jgi:hypothetical protein
MEETQNTPAVLSEEERTELTEFVATKMFSNLQFNQVLLTIENQCRAQAAQVVGTADEETVNKIRTDLAQVREESQILGGANVQEGAPQVPNFANVPTP